MSTLVLFSFEKVETMKIGNASLIGRNSKLLMKKLVFLDLERRKTMYVEKRLLKLVKTRIVKKRSNVHCSMWPNDRASTVWPQPILKKLEVDDKYHRGIKVHT